MARSRFHPVFLPLLLCTLPASAATVDVSVSDINGKAAANAVITLERQGGGGVVTSHLPAEAAIDQRNETFIPLVTILRQGGRIVFINNDTTMHQVYSFSPIKQFAFEVDEGHRSEPVVFEKPGVAPIGCNIHDEMITYVFVSDTPWAGLTDAKGHARLAEVPPGEYRAQIWHPQLVPGRPPPTQVLDVAGDATFTFSVSLLAAPPWKHMHMGSY